MNLNIRNWIGLAAALFVVGACACDALANDESPIRPGDRVALVGNTFADQLRMHGFLETLLMQRSAGKPVSIRNLGWAGDMLTARDRPTNFPTEESTLTDHKTDVIVACFGMGESFAGEAGLDNFRKDLEAFVASHKGRKYNGQSDVRLILISPIAYEDLGVRTPDWERRNRELAGYTQTMKEVSLGAGISFVDLNGPTAALMADSVSPKVTGNGVNLNQYGYWCVSRTLADALLPGPSAWHLTVDARTGKSTGSGVGISDVDSANGGVVFTVAERTWPSLGAPVKGGVHRDLESWRDTLIVMNLEAGEYRLEVDGQAVVTASHDAWAFGVALDSTPAHLALAAYRDAINDKNAQFVYSWKALNQVHIVGERRKSASGRALPAEVVEFKKLADEKDMALGAGLKLKTRQWRLVPVSSGR